MKVLLVVKVDPDKIINAHPKAATVEEAIDADFSYAMGVDALELDDLSLVIEPDSIPPNDADLGALIRPYLQN